MRRKARKVKGPRIRKGQVWQRKPDCYAHHTAEPDVVLITQGGDRPRGKKLGRDHIQHHFNPRSLWLFYIHIGTEGNYELIEPAVTP